MKRTIVALFLAVVAVISVQATAEDMKLPLDSAFSNVRPNNQKMVEVVEVADLTKKSAQAPVKMTVEQLVSNRPTISYSDIRGGSKLCTTDGSICVSAEKKPATIKVATFVNGIGEPQNVRSVSRKSFDEPKKFANASSRVIMLDCQVVDNKKTSNCRPASNA